MGKGKKLAAQVDADLYQLAASEAKVTRGRAGQLISHWARIGRELEQSTEVSQERVASVIGGQSGYDSLQKKEQTVVRAHWKQRIEDTRSNLRLDRRFTSEGKAYAELDDEGNVVMRESARSPEMVSKSQKSG